MMEILMGQTIEYKFNKGAGNTPPPVDAGTQPMQFRSKEEVTAYLEEQLPLMRLQNEYDKLMVEQLQNDALLNRRPIDQIPGLMGLELKIREIKALGFLAQYKMNMDEAANTQKEAQEAIDTNGGADSK